MNTSEDHRPVDVLLVVPPFATVRYPSIAASIFIAALRRQGVSCGVDYANLRFASWLGFAKYEGISESLDLNLSGERVFAAQAFPDASLPLPDGSLATPATISAFIHDTMERILDRRPKVVGFTVVFQQMCAAIAIARNLKKRDPQCVTVVGGGGVEDPMGDVIARHVDAFDHVFSGEADLAFPDFCKSMLQKQPSRFKRHIICQPLQDLNESPYPDYSDYFHALALFGTQRSFPTNLPASLPFEGSRGCWWGERHHCTFCGLNGNAMAHRAKSPENLVNEICQLVARYGIRTLHAVDNIMPLKHARVALPLLAKTELGLSLFYEVKANLLARDLDEFVRAGVHCIQPGIESFSTSVLKMLEKGTTGPANIALLRDCASRQINVSWNLLIDVPGDSLGDYESIISVIPSLVHLPPPTAVVPIVIDRFSPYFNSPEHFGISNLRPVAAYATIFPQHLKRAELAYHFEAEYESAARSHPQVIADLRNLVHQWKNQWSNPSSQPLLAMIALDSGDFYIHDSRRGQVGRDVISADVAAFLHKFDRPRPRQLVNAGDEHMVKKLLAKRWIVEHEGAIVNLVVEPETGFRIRAEVA